MRILILMLILTLLTSGCSAAEGGARETEGKAELTEAGVNGEPEDSVPEKSDAEALIDTSGGSVAERFRVPEGFARTEMENGSFGEYLRSLMLKPHGSKVKYYDGGTKAGGGYLAVIDMDTGARNLQQCADCVMRLRAEYLYGEKRYDDIHFNFTSGFRADYSKWRKGYRIVISDNKAAWMKKGGPSEDYASFRKYLDIVFAYAGTLSLSKELKSVEVTDLKAGDVFIKGGSPGHAVIVLDTAENVAGEKLFMLAQGYMPAQDMHVLMNPGDESLGPWYASDFGDTLVTPDWSFDKGQLMRFEE